MMNDGKGKKRKFEPNKSVIVKDGLRQVHFYKLGGQGSNTWEHTLFWGE